MNDRAAGETRRTLIGRTALAGGAAVGLGISGLLATATASLAQARNDSEILASSIYLEQIAAFSYERIATSGTLGSDSSVARLFARQEREHADALIRALADRGGSAPARPDRIDQVPGLRQAIADGPLSIAAFAIELEQAAVSGYYTAQATIEDPRLLQTAASIMACEAQHLVVLRQSSGRNPSPDAFVTGRRR